MTCCLGRYELHEVLGTGGFATVYRATDPSLEAVVAIKVLADNWSRDPDVRRRFRAEAVLLRRVQAGGSIPGLVEVHDIDEDDAGRPYYVMGYADRGTLAIRARGRRWSGADVMPVIDALAATVGALHDNDIVHRDLKPSNILLRSDGQAGTGGPGQLVARHERVLVADLGLAKDLQRDATSMSFAGGTRHYLAPEQLDPHARVDHRADVHAATAVISELMTGSPHPDPAGTPPAVGRALHRALVRGVAGDPGRRFESMARWRQGLLEAIATDEAVRPARRNGARSGGPGIQAPTRPPEKSPTDRRPASRGRVALVLSGLVAVVAGAWLAPWDSAPDRIVGPSEVVVGETVRYRAPAGADQSIVWTGPNGEQVRDEDLEVRPVVPGRLRIELLVDGDRTARTITAVPSPLGPRVDGPTEARVGETIVLRPVARSRWSHRARPGTNAGRARCDRHRSTRPGRRRGRPPPPSRPSRSSRCRRRRSASRRLPSRRSPTPPGTAKR
nr:serine/threonine protein kinase [Acidimicrobiia bacterium]